MAYRHGLRVSELIDLRLKDIDLDTSRLFVRRKKGSLSTHQPMEGDELRALRAWLRERSLRPDARSPYLFLSERGPFTRQAVNYIVHAQGPGHVRQCASWLAAENRPSGAVIVPRMRCWWEPGRDLGP